jgi:hypothetical protein
VFQIPAEQVELPDDERVILAERLQTGGKGRAVVLLTGGLVFISVVGIDPGFDQGVALEVKNLLTVRFLNPCIAYEHDDVT